MAPTPTIGYAPTAPRRGDGRDSSRNPRPSVRQGDKVWQFNGVWVVLTADKQRHLVKNGEWFQLPPGARIDEKNKRVAMGSGQGYLRFKSGDAVWERPKGKRGNASAGATLWRTLSGNTESVDYFEYARTELAEREATAGRPATPRAPLTGERGPAGTAAPRPPARPPAAGPTARPGEGTAPGSVGRGPTAGADRAPSGAPTIEGWAKLGQFSLIATPLAQMLAQAPAWVRVSVTSGFRDAQRQRELWFGEGARKYPNEEERDNWYARPGNSMHEHAAAADLSFGDDRSRQWFHANAGKFGLHFPLKNEAWHIEAKDSKGKRYTPQTAAADFAALRAGKPVATATGTQIRPGDSTATQGPEAPVAPTGQPAPLTGAPVGGPGSANPNAPAPAPMPLPRDATDAEIKDFIRANYGAMAAFIDDPSLGPDLIKAARQGLVGGRLEAFLTGTKWFQARTAKMREWDVAYRRDPKSAEAAIAQTAAAITQEAQRIGVEITPQRARDLAVKVNRIGWTPQQITSALSNEIRYNSATGQQKGEAGFGQARTTVDALKAQARRYLVPISDQTLTEWTRKIIAGTITAQDFESYLKEQAKSLFPGMGGAIDSGVDPSTYVAPYAQLAAQILEVNPAEVDFLNPKYGKALFNVDPKTGQRSAMSLADWQDYLRKTPDYKRTKGAREQAASFAQSLAETWGRI